MLPLPLTIQLVTDYLYLGWNKDRINSEVEELVTLTEGQIGGEGEGAVVEVGEGRVGQ